jgi:hypothetical protein
MIAGPSRQSLTVGVARALPPFLLGFDVLAPVSEEMLDAAAAHSFRWVGRYLGTIGAGERDRIFRRGIGILPYTVAVTRTHLSAVTGHADGEAASDEADAIGCAPLVHVPIDLELPLAGSDCASHVDAFARALRGRGRNAALYVGVPQPLTSAELFARVPDRYIKGGGRIEDRFGALAEPECGWSALQLEPLERVTLAGVAVDVAVSKLDYRGRALNLWWPA